MKTNFKSYNLQTNGKIMTISLQALFRAVGIGGEVSEGAVPASVLDDLRVVLQREGATGLEVLPKGGSADTRYNIDGDELTIRVAGLRPGLSRLFVFTKYGTNEPAALVVDLTAPQNVDYFVVDGVATPLERAAALDEEQEGTQYYAYAYMHGEVVVWFDTPALDYVHEVTAFVASGLDSTLADATEENGRVVRNCNVAVYDEEQDETVAPVDTFGGIGGGGASNLLIGTQAEREALVDPVEGLEFNEVHQDTETGVYHIERYIRENGAWATLESPQTETVETVTLHVSTVDGESSTEGLAVGITDRNTGVAISRVLNSAGECMFEIPKGHRYAVEVAQLEGYHTLPTEEFVAQMDERTITLVFQLASTDYETVVCHITVYNNQLQDITAQDTDLIGREIVCEIENGEPLVAEVQADHTATFQVQYGERYTIQEPLFSGFMTRYATKFTHVASIPQRTIAMHYVQWVNVGIYGITEGGVYYTHEQMLTLSDVEKATIKYIGLNTSRLQEAGASFFYKVPRVSANYKWADSNVEFDKTLLPFKQSHAAAVLDMNGQTNTQNIIAIGDSMGVGTPAADYCAAQTALLLGETKNGFLGAYGQMYALSENITELTAIHSVLGVAAPGFTSGYWWSSTQYNATSAVNLYNGGFYYSGKTSNATTVALFAL